ERARRDIERLARLATQDEQALLRSHQQFGHGRLPPEIDGKTWTRASAERDVSSRPRSPSTNTLTWWRIVPCSSSTQPSRRGYRRSNSRSTSPRASPGRSSCPCPSARSLSGARNITTAIGGSLGRQGDTHICGSVPDAGRIG